MINANKTMLPNQFAWLTIHCLQGVSREDAEILMKASKDLESLLVHMDGDLASFDEKMQPLLKLMSREIVKQKKRLGGDFAVAHAVVSR